MILVEPTNWVYDRISSSVAGERIHEAIFEGGADFEEPYSNSATQIRNTGSIIRDIVGLGSETFGFESKRGSNIALGAYVVGECPLPDYNWRNSERKTRVSNGAGDYVFIRQTETSSDLIYAPEYTTGSFIVDWGFWPNMLGLALMYFKRTRPDQDVNAFVHENFIDYDPDKLFSRVGFAECMTDAEIAGGIEPPERYFRLDDCYIQGLKRLFSKPIPRYSETPMMLDVKAGHRKYFVYFLHDNLYIGIFPEDRWDSEYRGFYHIVELDSHSKEKINVGGWVKFGPEDAGHLLRACLDQYARDRWEVMEIVDLFTWGMKLEYDTL